MINSTKVIAAPLWKTNVKFLPVLLLNYNFGSVQTCLRPDTLTVKRVFSEKFIGGIDV